MTAIERAHEMMNTKRCDLPKLAVEHSDNLGREVGICAEVCLTAFAHYAQAIEGLECNDEMYAIDNPTLIRLALRQTQIDPDGISKERLIAIAVRVGMVDS